MATDATRPLIGVPAGRARGTSRAAPRAGAGRGPDRLRALRRVVHPLLHELLVPLHRAARRLRAERIRRHGRVRPRVRGRARPGRDVVRRRVVPRVPRHRASDAPPRSGARRPRHRRADRRRPGRLSRDPRLSGPGAQRGRERHGDVALGADRGDDGAQERGRGRADPAERALVRARAPPPAGVLAAGCDRGGGEPARRARGDARLPRVGRRRL